MNLLPCNYNSSPSCLQVKIVSSAGAGAVKRIILAVFRSLGPDQLLAAAVCSPPSCVSLNWESELGTMGGTAFFLTPSWEH